MTEKQKKVLIVDDFGETGKILGEMFDHLHVETESVTNSEEALAKIDDNIYELVIADSRLRKVSGVSLLKRIREKNPETKVAVMSTFDTPKTQRLIISDNIDYYLPKPVKLKHLQQMLSDLRLEL